MSKIFPNSPLLGSLISLTLVRCCSFYQTNGPLAEILESLRGRLSTIQSPTNESQYHFEDLMEVTNKRLRLMMRLRPRGGIASCLTIDSDWKIRGGEETIPNWATNTDSFGFVNTGSTGFKPSSLKTVMVPLLPYSSTSGLAHCICPKPMALFIQQL